MKRDPIAPSVATVALAILITLSGGVVLSIVGTVHHVTTHGIRFTPNSDR